VTARVLAAVLAALLLAGCGPWGLRAGVVLPGGVEPYVEVWSGENPGRERAERNAEAD
jgi:hypothetical protein